MRNKASVFAWIMAICVILVVLIVIAEPQFWVQTGGSGNDIENETKSNNLINQSVSNQTILDPPNFTNESITEGGNDENTDV